MGEGIRSDVIQIMVGAAELCPTLERPPPRSSLARRDWDRNMTQGERENTEIRVEGLERTRGVVRACREKKAVVEVDKEVEGEAKKGKIERRDQSGATRPWVQWCQGQVKQGNLAREMLLLLTHWSTAAEGADRGEYHGGCLCDVLGRHLE
jgi:hypothetical protein